LKNISMDNTEAERKEGATERKILRKQINEALDGIIKTETLSAILSFVRVVRSRERHSG
jgi:hypothetical protein